MSTDSDSYNVSCQLYSMAILDDKSKQLQHVVLLSKNIICEIIWMWCLLNVILLVCHILSSRCCNLKSKYKIVSLNV